MPFLRIDSVFFCRAVIVSDGEVIVSLLLIIFVFCQIMGYIYSDENQTKNSKKK